MRFRSYIALATVTAFSCSIVAAATPSLWVDIAPVSIESRGSRLVSPLNARTMSVDYDALRSSLRAAPLEAERFAPDSPFEVSLPLPEGGFARFRVVESSVMEPELAKRYPELRTYLGQGIDDPTATARFDTTSKGFRAQIIGVSKTFYIEPLQTNDLLHYVAFNKSDYARSDARFVCGVTGEPVKEIPQILRRNNVSAIASGATLRTYRLALAATAEYTAAVGGTKLDALSAMVTTMNRVNGIYERELSVRMRLVGNTDALIFLNASADPYDNENGRAMLFQNQETIDSLIGASNYDIGHVFSTGGGGIAALGSVCASGSKARGVTGSRNPTADSFDVDFVAHEMGHQFNGEHTFNGSAGNCSGAPRAETSAYEPGSGVTIQAYAGICGVDDLQPSSDSYFHRRSLDQMLGFTTSAASGASCGVATATGNTPPTVTTTASFTIPRGTPFVLTASGNDANPDSLTYVWEQYDLGAANAAGVLTDNGGPLFRSFSPTTSPSRTFPSLRYILAGNNNVVPATAPLPGTSSPAFMTGELLPTTTRPMNFRVTVRDNRAGGGGTVDAATLINVTAAAGPFAVTGPNSAGISWAAGSSQTVAWDVASTNLAPVSTANVSIALSVDGGATFPTLLAASVPNNGSASVTIASGTPSTSRARIRVAAVGSVFFDINDFDFAILNANANTAPTLNVTGSVTTRQGSPAASAIVATVSDAQDTNAGALAVSVSEVPFGFTVTAANNAGNVSLIAQASCALIAPTTGSRVYPVVLTVTDSAGASTSKLVNVLVGSNQEPILGTYGNIVLSRGATAVVPVSIAPSDPNGNLLSVSVSPTRLAGSGAGALLSIAGSGAITVASDGNTTIGTQVVRATAADSCGAQIVREFSVLVVPPGPYFELGATTIAGDNNRLDASDCNTVSVSLNNFGDAAASLVSAVLSSSTPGVLVTQPVASFGNIASQAGSASPGVFQVSTTSSMVQGSLANFTLAVTFTGSSVPRLIDFTLPIGVDSSNYVFTATPGAASIPAGGTLIPGSNVDDQVFSVTVPAGFNFVAYGTTIVGGSTLRVSTNGVAHVGAGGSREYANKPLPVDGRENFPSDRFGANATVYFPNWDDLTLRTTDGGIYTQLVGVAPNRRFIIEWRGRFFADAATTSVNVFALILNEGSSVFEYHYPQAGTGQGANGVSATVGIQAATSGSAFTQYSFLQPVLSAGLKLTGAFPSATPGPGVCAAPALLNVDSSSAPDVYGGTTDAVILLRYLLGVRGVALTASIPATTPLRDFTQVEAHIVANLSRFDVDGDGTTRASTDGLMILRRLLGLSGSALTLGVNNSSKTPAEIANIIDAMKP